ncbi:MAG: bifunctional riboflavin kinase/FAD synthetase [Candidatus Muiribacteriota bacterium]
MNIFYDFKKNTKYKNCALSIGNFDGVHAGHDYILEKTLEYSKINNLKAAVFSFYNHPSIYINNLRNYCITTPDEKIKIMQKKGIDVIFSPCFEKYMNIEATEFLRMIDKFLSPSLITVGKNFHFGYKREGDTNLLKKFFKERANIIEPLKINGDNISSTKIRTFIKKGEVKKASEYLKRPFFMHGIVESGNRIGREFKVPTLNFRVKNSCKIIPDPGVYFSKTLINNKKFVSITNVGGAPTINFEDDKKIETHIFDIELQNMYNKKIKVEFIEFIRKEKKFKNTEDLVKQINKDIYVGKKLAAAQGEKILAERG